MGGDDKITYYVHVNSGKRDTTAYPNGNTYSMYLQNPIKNVVQVEVIVARIPNTLYNITSSGSPQIIFNGTTNITIPVGFYSDPTTLANVIQNYLLSGPFTWLPAEGKFLYLSENPDTIQVLTTDVATILGFDLNVQTASLISSDPSIYAPGYTYFIKSQFIGDMTKNDFIFLDIPELSHTKFQDAVSSPQMTTSISMYDNVLQMDKMVSISSGDNSPSLTGVFTGITMDVAPNTIKIFKNNDYPISISYDPPLSQVSKLTMNWYDKNRNLINFQGMEDNAVILRFTVKKEPVRELDWDFEVEQKVQETIPSLPPPKPIKEKKVWGRWFLILLFAAFVGLISLRRVSGPI